MRQSKLSSSQTAALSHFSVSAGTDAVSGWRKISRACAADFS
jgi:hypothetical protein